MTRNEIEIEELENVRERLFSEFPASFDDNERAFLLSVKRRKPDWEILGLPGIERLPALQ